MRIDFQDIKSIEIFKDLSPAELDEIIPIIHPMRVLEGERLIREGDPAHTFYIIVSGNFMLYFRDGRAFTLHKKGDIIGWTTVIRPFCYTTSAVALTDGDILAIPGEDFLQLIQGHSDLGPKIMKRIYDNVNKRLTFIEGIQAEAG